MKNLVLLMFSAVLLVAGCVNDKTSKSDSEAADTAAVTNDPNVKFVPPAPLVDIDTSAARIGNGAYDFNALVPLFPDIIAGTGRQTANGENYKMAGGMISSASASYNVQDRRFSVAIQDVGDNADVIPQLAKWSTMAMNGDDENEVMRSTLYLNQPAFIHYNKASRSGSYSVIYSNRFVVDITGRNVELAELEKAMEDLRIDRLK
ncbi:MAG: hypothetical protein IAE84_08810 [Saprospiraceae bacterium]|jgi:hypothetical protein|nr:hypothetical protein [Saprospiraceae bacterium]HRD82544.1 hypothetical protein [Saprospiraceae bacterium]HRK83157.1 hypothetical protein [Saprospiraceae bacterium]